MMPFQDTHVFVRLGSVGMTIANVVSVIRFPSIDCQHQNHLFHNYFEYFKKKLMF